MEKDKDFIIEIEHKIKEIKNEILEKQTVLDNLLNFVNENTDE